MLVIIILGAFLLVGGAVGVGILLWGRQMRRSVIRLTGRLESLRAANRAL